MKNRIKGRKIIKKTRREEIIMEEVSYSLFSRVFCGNYFLKKNVPLRERITVQSLLEVLLRLSSIH